MKKGHKQLKEWIIHEYLKTIKHDEPLLHDMICQELGIEIPPLSSGFRVSLPDVKWRKLNQGKDIDPHDEDP